MSRTPWSRRAWITISAPLISVLMVRSLRSPFVAYGQWTARIKKGPESPRAHRQLVGCSAISGATPGDAPPNRHHRDGNKIAHFNLLPSFTCAAYKALRPE